jgi:hypothetical protein
LVNEWYTKSSLKRSSSFLGRLLDTNSTQHQEALDELLVDHLLQETGLEVRYEESDGFPDFTIYRNGELYAAIEVRSLFEPPGAQALNSRFLSLPTR